MFSQCHRVWFHPGINECAQGVHTCGNNTECMDQPRSFTCMCKAGYAGNPFEECTGKYNSIIIIIVIIFFFFIIIIIMVIFNMQTLMNV